MCIHASTVLPSPPPPPPFALRLLPPPPSPPAPTLPELAPRLLVPKDGNMPLLKLWLLLIRAEPPTGGNRRSFVRVSVAVYRSEYDEYRW